MVLTLSKIKIISNQNEGNNSKNFVIILEGRIKVYDLDVNSNWFQTLIFMTNSAEVDIQDFYLENKIFIRSIISLSELVDID